MFTSAQATLVDATIAQGGYYHVKLSDLTKDDVQKLEANRDIKDFGNLTKNEKQISSNQQSTNIFRAFLHFS